MRQRRRNSRSVLGRRAPERRDRREWLRQVLSVAAAALVVLSARSVLADHYTVPSGSMLPTVEEGDRIVVDKRAYGLRLPFSRLYVLETADPELGEVVVVASPETGATLLKRVVAGPGDVVEVVSGRLFLNGEEVPIHDLDDGHLVEALGDHAHGVKLTRGGGPPFGPLRLPEDHYLVLGDNRGDSRDGRFFGLVSREHIRGRAHAVYWSGGTFAWREL